jgi:hypothetical protein
MSAQESLEQSEKQMCEGARKRKRLWMRQLFQTVF